ncbi:MAG TPA: hypothetical protein VD887_01180 [Allosphingosinicella sp.]|nr:hypothetical protein [Allosphingosinicella sp.]
MARGKRMEKILREECSQRLIGYCVPETPAVVSCRPIPRLCQL